jgi:hypothetical protein
VSGLPLDGTSTAINRGTPAAVSYRITVVCPSRLMVAVCSSDPAWNTTRVPPLIERQYVPAPTSRTKLSTDFRKSLLSDL